MDKLLAFLRRDALIAASYRTNMVMSVLSMITLVVPLYFISRALQPLAGEAIASEGGQYFGFVVAGMATYQLVSSAVGSLPGSLATGFRTGTFEIMLSTPTRPGTLLMAMSGYSICWSAFRAICMLVTGAALGADYALHRLPFVLLIWGAISLAYLPFGILGGALLILTRTTGPLPAVVLTGSMLLGGVYYPTHVIPSWLEGLSAAVPLTYGLRALRRVLATDLDGSSIATDLAILVLLSTALLTVALAAFNFALARGKRAGTLAQY